jgi:L-threonylcarbamoyladenylate synthase
VPLVDSSEPNVRRAAEIIRRGGVVAFPTETVYGLGADAFNPAACARVFAIKRRPRFDPLIVHVAAIEDATRGIGGRAVCAVFDTRAERLAAAFWPGPLTLVLPKTDAVPGIVTAGLPNVAIRVPEHHVARALLSAAGCPIAAPSANPFGYISPTLASHVAEQIGDAADLILDGGPCARGLESTIVDLSSDTAALLRPGAIPVERIERLIGLLVWPSTPGGAPTAPGQLESHYAPRVPVVLLDGPAPPAPTPRAALLAFGTPPADVAATYAGVELLSASQNLDEAATRLFACLHRLDAAGYDTIYADRVPAEGLGVAILDRLSRAAAPR